MMKHIHRLRDLDPANTWEQDLLKKGFRYICTTCGHPLKLASGVKL